MVALLDFAGDSANYYYYYYYYGKDISDYNSNDDHDNKGAAAWGTEGIDMNDNYVDDDGTPSPHFHGDDDGISQQLWYWN